MKCPRCNIKLERRKYETINILCCAVCSGTLIQPDRLSRVAATLSTSAKELMDRWRSFPPRDASEKCRCPECRMRMEHRPQRGGLKVDNHECKSCNFLWLDAGEIEIYLLAYMVSEKGKEAQRFKMMHEQMTPQEKEALETRIKSLPAEIHDRDGGSGGITDNLGMLAYLLGDNS